MERVLSADERIRKAEEIYARRKLQSESRKSATVNVDNRNSNKLVKKLIILLLTFLNSLFFLLQKLIKSFFFFFLF